jgi:cysteine synthase
MPSSPDLSDRLGLEREVVDRVALEHSVTRFREQRIVLPTFAQLANPSAIPAPVRARLSSIDRDAADAANLFRVHWLNDPSREVNTWRDVPPYVVLPKALTGVDAPIIVVLGDPFPMIGAHKVLAAYSCLAPRVITGRFDPTRHRAIWPSTGNYARGGVAISRLMGVRGVAVLPAGMSNERFEWLDRWVTESGDIIRTPGSESNVKEIYDACNELALDPTNFVLNQFCEFGNYLGHLFVTAPALGRAFEHIAAERPALRLGAFVSATGSAGTIGAGDHLKATYGSRIVAVEALECPTMLENGFGEHNIQGIGDKHIPLIHNVMNTDMVVAISDRATDELDVVFNTEEGREFLARRKDVPADVIASLSHFGLSSICNVLAAIKTARRLSFGPDDAVITVATDGASLYASERAKTVSSRFRGSFGTIDAAEAYGQHIAAADVDHVLELDERERTRIFNLGYFTWVEQQGLPFDLFVARKQASFWTALHPLVAEWDALIDDFNARVGLGS